MLNKLIDKELERANVMHGPYFPTVEHTLTVLREEVEEVIEECSNLEGIFNKIWKGYRHNNIDELDYGILELRANNIIKESIQVLAMIKKYKQSKNIHTEQIEQIKEMTQEEFLRVLGAEE